MTITIRSKVIKIGNSRGIRIPRTILDQAGLKDEVEMKVEGNRLVILPAHQPRQDWEAHFAGMSAQDDDRLLDDFTPTTWDEEEWRW